MILPTLVILSVFLIWSAELVLKQEQEEKKTPEQELGDAIAKYLSQTSNSKE